LKLLVLILYEMCNRFGSLGHGLVKCANVNDMSKSAQSTPITENTTLIRG